MTTTKTGSQEGLLEKNYEESSWLSIVEHLKDQIYDLKNDKEDLEGQITDLKIKNRELTKYLSMM